jgi:hypothetical protein
MPETHIWLISGKGREDRRYILFGNQPPPWEEPALPELLQRALTKRLEKARAEVADEPSETQPASAPATSTQPIDENPDG